MNLGHKKTIARPNTCQLATAEGQYFHAKKSACEVRRRARLSILDNIKKYSGTFPSFAGWNGSTDRVRKRGKGHYSGCHLIIAREGEMAFHLQMLYIVEATEKARILGGEIYLLSTGWPCRLLCLADPNAIISFRPQ